MGKGPAAKRSKCPESEIWIAEEKTGSEGPVPSGSHHVYGGYEALFTLFSSTLLRRIV